MTKNYIIAVNENGQPFIAHKYAYGSGVAGRGHKYVQRVKLSNGKYRYFYSQKDYETYLRLKDKNDSELDERYTELIKKQEKLKRSLKSKEESAWERLGRYIDKYGKHSSQAKWAEREFIKVMQPVRDIEAELHRIWELRNGQEYPSYSL